MLAHCCNSSYLEGGGQEDQSSRPAQGKNKNFHLSQQVRHKGSCLSPQLSRRHRYENNSFEARSMQKCQTLPEK
jgi:hypothetical protein